MARKAKAEVWLLQVGVGPFPKVEFVGCFLMLWSSDMRYSPFKTVSLQNQVSIQPNHFSMGITMGKFPQIGFWSFHELGACQSGLVCTVELVFDSSFQGYPTCVAYGPMAIWPQAYAIYQCNTFQSNAMLCNANSQINTAQCPICTLSISA